MIFSDLSFSSGILTMHVAVVKSIPQKITENLRTSLLTIICRNNINGMLIMLYIRNKRIEERGMSQKLAVR